MSKEKKNIIKPPEIRKVYLSMNTGREFLESHQSFRTLPFQKKSHIKTSSLMVPDSILIKLCWSPHSAKLRGEEERVNGSWKRVLWLSNHCVQWREKDQMIILYTCPIGTLVKGSLAQWICSMKAPPSQKCCMTFIQKENVALNLNSLMIHFKVLLLAIFSINVITLFWLL